MKSDCVTIRIDKEEVALIQALRTLEFGELLPKEVVHSGQTVVFEVVPSEKKLLEMIEEYGTPHVISVTDSRPMWGVFVYQTRAGPAKKHIKFS